MKRHSLLLGVFFIGYSCTIFAQPELPEYGSYSQEEMAMTECSFDKDAEAIILLESGYSYYDDTYQLITERRVRIKILKQSGVERGTITIPFFSKDNFETIKKVEGMTYNAYESNPVSAVSKKSIYIEKTDDRISKVKFALPNVKPGSIIEYRYTSIMKHYGGLENWFFQSDIPSLRSCYKLVILPNCDFSYLVTKSKFLSINIIPSAEEGSVYFEMNNIPGLRSEPYMDAARDYLQKVEFKFSGCVNRYGSLEEANETWKSVANELATSEYLGGTSKTNLLIPPDLADSVAKSTSDAEKISTIYNYVRNNFAWNGYNGKYANDGLKKVWEAKTGAAGELNLVLINLLKEFKFDAKPVLVAERNFGKVDPAQVYVDRFNKTLAFIEIPGKIFIMDATQKYTPATLIPYEILNTLALIIDKKTEKPVEIVSTNEFFKRNVTITASINKEGLVKGTAILNSFAYAKESAMKNLASDNKSKHITEDFEMPYNGLKIDSFYFVNPANDDLPLTENLKFINQLDESGGFLLFNYNLFTSLSKSPFLQERRFTNINFGYPVEIEVNQSIELPPGSKTDDLLKDRTIENGQGIILSRQIKRNGNTLNIKINFKQSLTLIAADGYDILKNLYKSMVEMLSEPVVIKLPK